MGDILTVDLYVEGVSDLYGVDLQLTFDTAIADVVDEDAGLPGVQILPLSGFLQPDFAARKMADNDAGTIQYANTQLDPTPPANGSGSVARVRLLGQAAGTFNMTFTTHELADRDGLLISGTAQDCTITFGDPTAVALSGQDATRAPWVGWLWPTAGLGAAAVVYGLLRRRRAG